MTKSPAKTNAARLLDRAGIAYELIPYEVDENDLAATHVAESLGEDISRVFKTIVLRTEPGNGHIVCVLPGDCEVDLKKAAKVASAKKVEPVKVSELLGLTGYIRGGCSPVGMKKPFPVIFHSTAQEYDFIYVSAGQRGLQLKVDPKKLIAYTKAAVADITSEFCRDDQQHW